MQYYIKQWPDRKVSLIAENGLDLTTFYNIEQAVAACRLWCNNKPVFINGPVTKQIPEYTTRATD